MPRFKNKATGKIIEVSEDHAEAVIRRQGRYNEIDDEPLAVPTKKSKKKSKKKGV